MKKIISKFSLVAASLAMVVSAQAEVSLKGATEFGPYVGMMFDLGDYNSLEPDSAVILGGRLGVFLSEVVSIEGTFHRASGTATTGANMDLDSTRLNVLFHARPNKHFRPFITLGGGWERYDMDGFSVENDYGLNAGLGFRIVSKNGASIRVDGRYNTVEIGGPVSNDRQHNIETTLGFSWLFGVKAEEAPKAPADGDKDGVIDGNDQCPNTAADAKVDANGCEIVMKTEDPDSDGDNVADDVDKCPNTPSNVSVGTNGCPLDSDKDGVADYKDKCPATEAGTKIDEYGCPPEVAQTRGALKDVTFELGKTKLTPNSETILNGVARVMNKYPNFNVEVQGHTDSTGSAAINMKLSGQRAESVRDYLISQGVDAKRLTARGYGQSSPVADNSTKEGRAQNRRVELKWID